MRRIPCLRVLFGLLLSVFVISAAAAAPIATTTTVTAAPTGTVAFHDLVTLRATVVDANNAPVLHGTVNFYASGGGLIGQILLGSAPVVSNSIGGFTPGTATLNVRWWIQDTSTAQHSIVATFTGTASDTSSSGTTTLGVTITSVSATGIPTATGSVTFS